VLTLRTAKAANKAIQWGVTIRIKRCIAEQLTKEAPRCNKYSTSVTVDILQLNVWPYTILAAYAEASNMQQKTATYMTAQASTSALTAKKVDM
jgi:hypothetical protein